MKRVVEHVSRLEGTLKVPGDKSISHRALILGAAARGRQAIEGLSDSADVASTADALRAIGCFVETMPDGRTMVMANSLRDSCEIDAGNSGTTARLLMGFAAARLARCRIDGDASLRARPMARVAEPLARMGARVTLSGGGRLPATVEGGNLAGIHYEMPVASAQVKSAVLIAGLFAGGETTVVENVPTRDHTELMLRAMGADLSREGNRVCVRGGGHIEGTSITVPGDFSSAAFFLVAAALLPGSRVHLPFTGVNPRRTALLRVLQEMGARVVIDAVHAGMAEPAGDLAAAHSELQACTVEDPATVASLIDEIPVLAIAATQAHGRSTIRGAAELRHKESDRIAALARGLGAMGARVEEFEDGLAIEGPTRLRGAAVSSFGDHRIAMALTVAALVADGPTEIDDDASVAVSYPRFFHDLASLSR